MVEFWTHVLCLDHVNVIKRVGMPLVMNVRNDLWFPTFLIKYCLAFLWMHGREVACLSAFSPACSSCNQIIQQNYVEVMLGTGMSNYIPPSVRYFDHVFEELRVHIWS